MAIADGEGARCLQDQQAQKRESEMLRRALLESLVHFFYWCRKNDNLLLLLLLH